jgi:hypothetical protein
MTFPTVDSVTNRDIGSGTSTTHSVVLPATIAAGKRIIVLFSVGHNVTVTWDQATAGTWINLFSQTGAGVMRYVAYTKIADGSEGGLTLAPTTNLNACMNAQILLLSGMHATDIEAAVTDLGASVSAGAPPSLDPSGWGAEDTLWIAAMGWDDESLDNELTGYPTNYTQNRNTCTGSSSARKGKTACATRELNTANETDTGTFTLTAATIGAVSARIAVRSASAGPITSSGTPAAQAADVDGVAERVVTSAGAPAAQAATVAGAGTLLNVRSAVLTAANGRELRDHDNAVVASLSGILFEWYDDPDDTDGNPTHSGTFNTNGSGEATVVLTGSTLPAGGIGGLLLIHPSDNTIRGYYRVPVTLT